ncbi:MAG: hypothetical protein IPJ30_07315 [Acidobacteria bacterium]|nr:hypothetical protein [Acidobacteriota bacterium]
MKVLFFSMYYVRLRFDVTVGRQRTSNPLGLQWRWRYWKSQQRLNCNRLF